MSRRVLLIAGGVVAALLVAAGLYLFVLSPAAADDARSAVVEHVEERSDTEPTVLAEHDWGEGRFVLVGYEVRGVRRLGLGFASEGFRGFRVAAYTEETVEPDDVKNLGSLLVASSDGGSGQPPWSAAVGELTDTRVDRVEIRWASGDTSIGSVNENAFLVLERGTTAALEARYLAEDGTEIAKVPVDEGE